MRISRLILLGLGKPVPVDSPVLVIDALGFAAKIRRCGHDDLIRLSDTLDQQFDRFRATIPYRFVATRGTRVIASTNDFSTFRLNDMFVLFTESRHADATHRLLVTSCLLYQALLIEGFIPRGGLGAGLVLRRRVSLARIGSCDLTVICEGDQAARPCGPSWLPC